MRDASKDRDLVIAAVCDAFGDVDKEAIMGKGRKAREVTARHFVLWALYRFFDYSSSEVGESMGMVHASVLHSARVVDDYAAPSVRRLYEEENSVIAKLKEMFGRKRHRLEDSIISDINNAEPTFDDDLCYAVIEEEYDNVKAMITVDYIWHEETDCQHFDWGWSDVQTANVVDGIADISIVCYDKEDNDVPIDIDYIYKKLAV